MARMLACRWLLGAALGVIASGPGALAQDLPEGVGQAPWFREFQRALRAAWVPPAIATQGKVNFVVGAEAVHAGRPFAASERWLALSCADAGCRLVPATLSIDEPHRGRHGSATEPRQLLRFTTPATPDARVVAWFRTDPGLAWLRPGEVVRHFDGSAPPSPTGQGSEEARIDLPGGASARLVPLLLRRPGPEDERPPVLLQLRAEGRRQLLPGLLGRCTFSFAAAQYLLWAGDLDRDGQADYLIRFADGNGPIHLYLSGQARAGKLVGLAGVYNPVGQDIACGAGDS